MDTPERQKYEPEDFESGDEWFEEELFDPEDIPLPGGHGGDLDEYIERKQKKRKQRERRKERNDRYRIDRDTGD